MIMGSDNMIKWVGMSAWINRVKISWLP